LALNYEQSTWYQPAAIIGGATIVPTAHNTFLCTVCGGVMNDL